MLTPEYLNSVSDDAVTLYREMEDAILSDVTKRIVNIGMLDVSVWQTEATSQQRGVLTNVLGEINGISDSSQSTIKKIYEDALSKSLAFDNDVYTAAGLSTSSISESDAMKQILSAGVDKTYSNITNMSNTITTTAQTAFYNAIYKAYTDVSTGSMDYTQAIANAIGEISESGVKLISNGKDGKAYRYSMDAAVRRAVQTGVNQAVGELQIMAADELGAEQMEVSAHIDSRPDHAQWQGKVLDYPDEFMQTTGYGTGAGLCGWNCRHSFHPFIPGVSERMYTDEQLEAIKSATVEYNGKQMSLYKATQAQRRLEREMRAAERKMTQLNGAIADAEGDEALQAVLRQEMYTVSTRLTGLKSRYGDYIDTELEEKNLKNNLLYNNYKSILGEDYLGYDNDEFIKVMEAGGDEWEKLKSDFKIVERYAVDFGDVPTSKIIELDNAAWYTKQNGFDGSNLPRKKRDKVILFKERGNAAVMEMNGKIYFAYSKAQEPGDLAFDYYFGDYELVALSDSPIFETIGFRNVDTEAKFLEFAAKNREPSDTFEITILSEKHICESCQGVVKQFQEMFPNAKVNVVSGKEGYNNDPSGNKTWKNRKD